MWIAHGNGTRGNRGGHFVAWGLILCAGWPAIASATDVVVKDGRTLSGKVSAPIASLVIEKSTVAPSNPPPRSIQMLDDDLRRVYVPLSSVREVNQAPAITVKETFRLTQRTMRNGPAIKSVGPFIDTPFDEWGRRTVTMLTTKGPVAVIQGITVITPEWCKVEGISHVWDMRLATSSIPRDVLAKILRKQIKNLQQIDDRLKLARFYIHSVRLEEAQAELQAILADFPGDAIKPQLQAEIATLYRMKSERYLSELRQLRTAGQYAKVAKFLEKFPTENIPGDMLQAAREMLNELKVLDERRKTILDKFNEVLGKIGASTTRKEIAPLYTEMKAELTLNTLDRFAPFLQNMNDDAIAPDDKAALAISGWIMGPDAAVSKLSMALSAYRMREAIRAYINDPTLLSRVQRFSTMNSEEAAGLPNVAAIIANMKPPLDTPPNPEHPDFFELQIPGLQNQAAVPYVVQLPPEYDPLRRYPAIVTLHGSGTTAEHQVDWWAGPTRSDGPRRGQAGRYGYIVIAPAWGLDHQKEYGYSARETNAVLGCLHDACCRFAIDTDRVFLTGHSMGGDAAWDQGLAHPDLWAGVIPIVAKCEKYVIHYTQNAKMVPLYFVCGELDGTKMQSNAQQFDLYLQRRYSTTVVEYQGRGHEEFSDEILHLFDWMGRYHRDFYPREFDCATMRSWDNFFWWLEVTKLSAGGLIDPDEWTMRRNFHPVEVKSSRNAANGLSAQCMGAGVLNIWVSPQLFDLSRQITIAVNGQSVNPKGAALPNLKVLLEDVRTRGDRQHPFWAKIEMPIGRAAK